MHHPREKDHDHSQARAPTESSAETHIEADLSQHATRKQTNATYSAGALHSSHHMQLVTATS